jgi:uncharacterized protein
MTLLRRLSVPARLAAYRLRQIGKRSPRPVPGIRFDRDVPVTMRDGARLMTNVFLPERDGRYPVLMAVSPYSKDALPNRDAELLRSFGMDVGPVHTSDYTAFEAADPAFWVPLGYAVVHGNVRGMWNSQGNATWLSAQDAEDYRDLIEWAAIQPWSSSKVGLCGASYLAMSQWRVAALNPPHLAAIMPWEGVTDQYREFAFQGGIRETGFLPAYYRNRIRGHHNPGFPLGEDFLDDIQRHQLDDDYWASKRPDLARITAPALVCTSWSDQGLHTRGSLEGFLQIGCEHKWLYTHGRRKLEVFYSPEAQVIQRQFFDFFLKGLDNGMLDVPQVRLEVRHSLHRQDVREEPSWPVPGTSILRLHLDARRSLLVDSPVADEGSVAYEASRGRASFVYRFDRDTEVTGGMRLQVWLAPEDSDDADLFVGIEKLSPTGEVVGFYGSGISDDVVAKGWLRLSHRELDENQSTETRPWHTHRRIQKVGLGEVTPADVEILPSSTIFESGSSLRLIVQGHELRDYTLGHGELVNKGRHRVLTGGPHDAFLTMPVIEVTT